MSRVIYNYEGEFDTIIIMKCTDWLIFKSKLDKNSELSKAIDYITFENVMKRLDIIDLLKSNKVLELHKI